MFSRWVRDLLYVILFWETNSYLKFNYALVYKSKKSITPHAKPTQRRGEKTVKW